MTRKQMTTIVGGLVLALVATTGQAQVTRERATDAEATQPTRQAQPERATRDANQAEQTCLASELIGMVVNDSGQQQVGTVKDAVIGHDGQVRYLAVVTSDASATNPRATTDQPATATARSQYVLIPFQAINADAKQEAGAEKSLVLKKSKAELMKAPKFSHAQLSNARDNAWMAEVNRFFDINDRGTSARPDLEGTRNRDREQDRDETSDDN